MASPDNPQFEPQPPVEGEHPPAFQPLPAATIGGAGVPTPVLREAAENPVWSGWAVLLVVVLAIVCIVVFQFSLLLGAKYLFYPRSSLQDLSQNTLLLLISQFLIDGAVFGLLLLLIEGFHRTPFWKAIRWNWPGSWWKLLGSGAIMFLALSFLERLLPMPKDTPFEKLFANPRDAYLLSLIAVSLGPLVEELFFRGFLYPVIARRWGIAWGIFLTALPFAVMHLPQYGYAWGALVIIFIVGAVCGAVRAMTHSVGASFLVHVGYNGVQMLIAILWTRGFTQMPQGCVNLWFR